MKRVILSLLVMLCLVGMAYAENKTWKGTKDSVWKNPENWDPPGVPTKNDDVTIPNNSPSCLLEGTVVIKSLTNNGDLLVGDCYMSLENVTNNGNISIDEDLHLSSEKNFDNNGNISGENASLGLFAKSDFLNNGSINGKYVYMKGKNIGNSYSGSIEGKKSIDIKAENEVTNDNIIKGKRNETPGEEGCNIYIECEDGDVNNFGDIFILGANGDGGRVIILAGGKFNNWNFGMSGDGENGRKGGDFEVIALGGINNKNGNLYSGTGSKGGDLSFYSVRTLYLGTIATGHSPFQGKKTLGKTLEDPEGGSVFIAADSVIVDDHTVCNGMFEVITNHFVCKVDEYLEFFSKKDMNIYITPEGNADFSDTHTENSLGIYDANGYYGSINIYSDQIIEPTEGLNFVCNLDPNIFPSDANLVRGTIVCSNAFEDADVPDTIEVTIQNQSTASKVLNYDVSSTKGWVTPTTGSTSSLNPFAFDSVLVNYMIPAGTADGDADTVTAILSIAPDFADTCYSTIACIGDTAEVTGILEDKVIVPSTFTLSIYPNPFNSACKIIAPPNSTIKIFDITGRQVSVLDGMSGKKMGHFIWQPMESLSSGRFIVQAETEMGTTMVKRVVYLK